MFVFLVLLRLHYLSTLKFGMLVSSVFYSCPGLRLVLDTQFLLSEDSLNE